VALAELAPLDPLDDEDEAEAEALPFGSAWMAEKHLSVSRAAALHDCPKKAYWVYELPAAQRPPNRPGNALLEGTAVHAGVEVLLLAARDARCQGASGARAVPLERLLVLAHEGLDDAYDRELDGAGGPAGVMWAKQTTPDFSRRLAHRLLDAYVSVPPLPRTPTLYQRAARGVEEVEVPFDYEIPGTGGWRMRGRIDHVEAGRTVDLKTAGRAYTRRDVAKKMQPTAYVAATQQTLGVFRPQFAFHVLIKPPFAPGGPPPAAMGAYKTQEIATTRTLEDVATFEEHLADVIQQVEAGVFPRRLEFEFCDWCFALRICQPGLFNRLAAAGELPNPPDSYA
jgi:PD-(D/E)XK nuclease superfamily